MPALPRISVIIPHLNQPQFLDRCLTSLEAQSGEVPAFEIIVVDNGSQQMPDDVVARRANVTLLREETPGPGPARNLGAKHARGDLLAFIDADCLAGTGWLARINAYFAANPAHSILGGDVFIARMDAHKATYLEAYESIYAYRMREYIAKQGFTGTGNLAVRAQVMDEVGPFGGIGIAEDRDWGQRATKLGHATYYVDQMIVYHPARQNFRELQIKWDRHIAHDYELHGAANGMGGKLRWLARAGAVAVSPGPEIWRILRSKRVTGLSERLKALWILIRIRLYRARIMLGLAMGRSGAAMSGAWNRD